MNSNDKKIAVVTGGARGIGKAICKKFAKNGIHVILVSQSEKSSSNAANELNKLFPGMIEAHALDVSDYNATQEFGKKIISSHGKVNIIVNNAGITKDGLFIKMSEQDWDDVVNVNLKGAFNIIKSLYKGFIKQKNSKIINISSVAGVLGNIGQANYSASKAGLIGLSKTLAREFASRQVAVNVVAPGFITTDMTEELSDKIKDSVIKNIPFNKFGEVEDIANLVNFLASDKAAYITGQVICADGGMCI